MKKTVFNLVAGFVMLALFGCSCGGNGDGVDYSPIEGQIRAIDNPLGFAGVNYRLPKFKRTVTVRTRSELLNAIENENTLIYVDGMIDMTDEGTGSKLPAMGTDQILVPSVMDSWTAEKTSGAYTTYEAWFDAYYDACTPDTNDVSNPSQGAHSSLYDMRLSLNNAWKSLIQLRPKSNTTIIGLGNDSGIRGGTIIINNVSNVVIRNLTLLDTIDMFPHHEYRDGYNSQFDYITIQGDSTSNIWIDHCTMKDTVVMHIVDVLNEYGTKEQWRCYDGLCDIKGLGAGITVSNCHMYHHDMTMNIGPGDDEGDNTKRKVSIINNHFDTCKQQCPLVRNTSAHILNNWYSFDTTQSVGGVNRADQYIYVRKGALIFSEANYFDSHALYSIRGKKSTASSAEVYDTGSVDENPREVYEYTAVGASPFTVPYSYAAMSADKAKAYVAANAGAGKWVVQQ